METKKGICLEFCSLHHLDFWDVCFLVFAFLAMFLMPLFGSSKPLITWSIVGFLVVFSNFRVFLCGNYRIDCFVLSWLFYSVYVLLTNLFSHEPIWIFSTLLTTFWLFSLYQYFCWKPGILLWYFLFLFLGLVLFAFVFFWEYRTEIFSGNISRLGENFGDENEVGLYLTLGFVLGLSFFFFIKNPFLKILLVLPVVLLAFCALSTGSKAVFFQLFFFSFLITALHFGKKRWYFTGLIFLAVVGLSFFLLSLPIFSVLKNRLLTLFSFLNNGGSDSSSSDRLTLFLSGFELFLRSPIFGFGIHGFHKFNYDGNGFSHNQLTETLSQFGLLGGFFFFAPFLFSLLAFLKMKKDKTSLLDFSILLFFVIWMVSLPIDSLKSYPLGCSAVFAFFSLRFSGPFWNISFISKNNDGKFLTFKGVNNVFKN